MLATNHQKQPGRRLSQVQAGSHAGTWRTRRAAAASPAADAAARRSRRSWGRAQVQAISDDNAVCCERVWSNAADKHVAVTAGGTSPCFPKRRGQACALRPTRARVDSGVISVAGVAVTRMLSIFNCTKSALNVSKSQHKKHNLIRDCLHDLVHRSKGAMRVRDRSRWY